MRIPLLDILMSQVIAPACCAASCLSKPNSSLHCDISGWTSAASHTTTTTNKKSTCWYATQWITPIKYFTKCSSHSCRNSRNPKKEQNPHDNYYNNPKHEGEDFIDIKTDWGGRKAHLMLVWNPAFITFPIFYLKKKQFICMQRSQMQNITITIWFIFKHCCKL